MEFYKKRWNLFYIIVSLLVSYMLFYICLFEIKSKLIQSHSDSISQEVLFSHPSLHASVLPFIDCGAERQKRNVYFFRPFDFSSSSLTDLRAHISVCAKEADLPKTPEIPEALEIDRSLPHMLQNDAATSVEVFPGHSSLPFPKSQPSEATLEAPLLIPENAYRPENIKDPLIETAPLQDSQSTFSVIRPKPLE